MNASQCRPGMRVVLNSNIGEDHKDRLVPGMVGTVDVVHGSAASIVFDQPMMKEFLGSWTKTNVRYERFDPAPEAAIDFVNSDSQ